MKHEPKRIGIWPNRGPRWDGYTRIVESKLDGRVESTDEDSAWDTLGLIDLKSCAYAVFEGLVPLASPTGGEQREGY